MYKYTALIIEPRKHKALEFVLNNFLYNLSNDWQIIIFHGNNNIEYIKNIFNKLDIIYPNRITNLINLNIDNLHFTQYNNLFFSETLYSYIPNEIFIVFQTDSIILNDNKDLINLFLDFDYIGAPWRNKEVGNGGFSIRKKSKMLEILKIKGCPRNQDNVNEDQYFSCLGSKRKLNIEYNIANFETANRFSVETVFNEKPFGIHNCWKYLNQEEILFLTTKYPEISELIKLQYNE
jgi:hypothetical protein